MLTRRVFARDHIIDIRCDSASFAPGVSATSRDREGGRFVPRVYVKTDPVERFWSRVDRTESCWIWTAAKTGSGYGNFSPSEGVNVSAHIFSYELEYGPVPRQPGIRLVLDHLCRRRDCVRPSHLELVTNRENILRGTGFSARHASATHCAKGHEFTPENTAERTRPEGGRLCRECRRIRNLQVTERRRSGDLLPSRPKKGNKPWTCAR